MYRCFISYPTIVESDAKELHNQLSHLYPENLEVFLACNPESIAPGEPWYQKLLSELASTDCLLILFPSYNITPWVMLEAGAVLVQSKPVITLRYRGLEVGFVPQPLAPNQSVDLTNRAEVKQLLLGLATGRKPTDDRVKEFAESIAAYFSAITFRDRISIRRPTTLPSIHDRINYLSVCSESQRLIFQYVLEAGGKGALEKTIRTSVKICYEHRNKRGPSELQQLRISDSEYYYRLRELYHIGLLEMKKVRAFQNRWYVSQDVVDMMKELDQR